MTSREMRMVLLFAGVGAIAIGIALLVGGGALAPIGYPLFWVGVAVIQVSRARSRRGLGWMIVTSAVLCGIVGLLMKLIVYASEAYPPEPAWPVDVQLAEAGLLLLGGIALLVSDRYDVD